MALRPALTDGLPLSGRELCDCCPPHRQPRRKPRHAGRQWTNVCPLIDGPCRARCVVARARQQHQHRSWSGPLPGGFNRRRWPQLSAPRPPLPVDVAFASTNVRSPSLAAQRARASLSAGPMPKRQQMANTLAMTRPITASRVVLVADRRELPSDIRTAPLRRFRLARMRLDDRDAAPRQQVRRA